ncbi:MAG: glycoside hydrolase family 127 protein [Armatimonadota bacterium]
MQRSTRPATPTLAEVPFTAVGLSDRWLAPRIERNRTAGVAHALQQCDRTGRLANFDNAAKRLGNNPVSDGFKGFFFNDSDVYKMLEGIARMLAVRREAALEQVADELIARIAAAQEKDGYLYTARTLCGADYMPPGGKDRWSDLGGGHELYCVGHLYEAAAAHFEATGKRSLLDIAVRNADLVVRTFGPEPGKLRTPDGHPEVEIGLVKLWKATGKRAYLDLARFFLDQRGDPGRRDRIGEYAQDHEPLSRQQKAVGHAVRAVYLYSGASDVGEYGGVPTYSLAAKRLWEDAVQGKVYVTGGIGSRGSGEAFGDRNELPNRTAYAETCAAIGLVLLCRRLFLRTRDVRAVDLLERTLHNGLLSGVSLEGTGCFYTNPLESRGGAVRPPWHDCACCPPNILRFLPTIPGLLYATEPDALHVSLYVASTARLTVAGTAVTVVQTGDQPWDGRVDLRIDPEKPRRFAIHLRIPGWARDEAFPSDLYRFVDAPSSPVRIRVNGRPVAVPRGARTLELRRVWTKGDRIEMDLPMDVRRIVAHPGVVADRDKVAFQRGPLVYCAEGIDQAGRGVLARYVGDEAPVAVRSRPDLLGGIQALEATAGSVVRRPDGSVGPGSASPMTLVPYALWANRGRGEMAVWLGRRPEGALTPPARTLARTAKWSASGGTGLESLVDQQQPASSIDHANPFFHWWPRKGTAEWVEAELSEPSRVGGVSVYWFDDTGIGECRLPARWTVRVRVDGRWVDAAGASTYGTAPDTFNTVRFTPVRAEAVRLEIQLPAGFAAGMHEVRILDENGRDSVRAR